MNENTKLFLLPWKRKKNNMMIKRQDEGSSRTKNIILGSYKEYNHVLLGHLMQLHVHFALTVIRLTSVNDHCTFFLCFYSSHCARSDLSRKWECDICHLTKRTATKSYLNFNRKEEPRQFFKPENISVGREQRLIWKMLFVIRCFQFPIVRK